MLCLQNMDLRTPINCFVVVLVGCVLLHYSGTTAATLPVSPDKTTLTSNLDTVIPGVTKLLKLTCTFPGTQAAGVASLLSLVITKIDSENARKDIASVSSFNPDTATQQNVTFTNIDWTIDERSGSFLSIEWKYPNETESGIYECEANALDQTGHPVQMFAGWELKSKEADVLSLADRFREVQQSLDDFRERFEQPVSSLFSRSSTVNSTYYLLSKVYFTDVDKAEAYCNWAGGYLVEIDTKDEQNYLKNFIGKDLEDPLVTYLLIGLSDKNTEGNFRFRFSGQKTTFLDWSVGEPNGGDKENCVVVDAVHFHYFNVTCSEPPLPVPFMCEVKA